MDLNQSVVVEHGPRRHRSTRSETNTAVLLSASQILLAYVENNAATLNAAERQVLSEAGWAIQNFFNDGD